MSVTGLCQVCENATATYGCQRCGRAVCEDHWNDGVGACTACVQGRQQ